MTAKGEMELIAHDLSNTLIKDRVEVASRVILPCSVRREGEVIGPSDHDTDKDDVTANRLMSILEKTRLEGIMTESNIHPKHSQDVPLLSSWCFWIDKNVRRGVSERSFLDSLHNLGSFSTSHAFSDVLLTYADELINIHQHSEKCNIRLFRDGITPIRESAANVLGGQYVVFLPTDRLEVQRLWLECLISLVTERFTLKTRVVGVVLGLKRRADSIGIWTNRGCHPGHYQSQKEHICDVLGLPRDTKIKYNNHTKSKSRSASSSNNNSTNPTPTTSPSMTFHHYMVRPISKWRSPEGHLTLQSPSPHLARSTSTVPKKALL